MKVTKTVDVTAEVEISISTEDICCALSEVASRAEGESHHAAMMVLNSVAQAMRAVSDDHIAAMSGMQTACIRQFLSEQLDRYTNIKVPK